MPEGISPGPEDQGAPDPLDALGDIEGTWDAQASELGVDPKELQNEGPLSEAEIDKQVESMRIPDTIGLRSNGQVEAVVHPVERTPRTPSSRDMGGIALARQAGIIARNSGDVAAIDKANRVEAARSKLAHLPMDSPKQDIRPMDLSDVGNVLRRVEALALVEKLKADPELRRKIARKDHLAGGEDGAIEQMALASVRLSTKADKAEQKGDEQRAENLRKRSKNAAGGAERNHAYGTDSTRKRRWFWQRQK